MYGFSVVKRVVDSRPGLHREVLESSTVDGKKDLSPIDSSPLVFLGTDCRNNT